MKVGFEDSFFDSLKRLNRHGTWWYKTYEFFRYDIWRFFGNIWRFRKELYDFYPWDYSYNLSLFRRSLELTGDYLENKGIEENTSRIKKVAKIREAIVLLKNIRKDSHIDKAEAELGKLVLNGWDFEPSKDHPGSMVMIDNDTEEEKEHNSKVFARANEIQEEEWKLLWKIIQGQDHEEYRKDYEKMKESGNAENAWNDWFDGSGIKSWWD